MPAAIALTLLTGLSVVFLVRHVFEGGGGFLRLILGLTILLGRYLALWALPALLALGALGMSRKCRIRVGLAALCVQALSLGFWEPQLRALDSEYQGPHPPLDEWTLPQLVTGARSGVTPTGFEAPELADSAAEYLRRTIEFALLNTLVLSLCLWERLVVPRWWLLLLSWAILPFLLVRLGLRPNMGTVAAIALVVHAASLLSSREAARWPQVRRRVPLRQIALWSLALMGTLLSLALVWQLHDAHRTGRFEVGLELGERVPVTTLRSPDGRSLQIPDPQGRIVVIAQWATWCGACVPKIKALDDLLRLDRQSGTSHLRVVALNVSDEPRAARRAAAAWELEFVELAMGTERTTRLFPWRGTLPTTHVLSGDGRLSAIITGFHASTLLEQLRLPAELETELRAAQEGEVGPGAQDGS